MNPVFHIAVDGEDYTRRIQERLVALTIQDQAGMENDTLNVTVDDRDGVIEFPPVGAKIDVWLGYEKKDGHTNPVDKVRYMGRFVLSEYSHSKDPNAGMVLTLTAKAMYDGNGLKQTRTGSFHRKKIHEIVSDIAERNGLKARIHEDVRNIIVDHVDQNAESDMQFLTRLSIRYGCVMKIGGVESYDLSKLAETAAVAISAINSFAGLALSAAAQQMKSNAAQGFDNELLFAPQQKMSDISRLITDEFDVRADYISSWNYLCQGRGSYGSVSARYEEREVNNPNELPPIGQPAPDTGKIEEVFSKPKGSSDGLTNQSNNHELTPVYPNKKEAEAAVKAKQAQFDASVRTFSFSAVGHPNMVAESKVKLSGFRDGIPTEWLVVKVTHKFDNGGYTNDVDCETPKDVQAMIDASSATSSP